MFWPINCAISIIADTDGAGVIFFLEMFWCNSLIEAMNYKSNFLFFVWKKWKVWHVTDLYPYHAKDWDDDSLNGLICGELFQQSVQLLVKSPSLDRFNDAEVLISQQSEERQEVQMLMTSRVSEFRLEVIWKLKQRDFRCSYGKIYIYLAFILFTKTST